MTQNNPKERHVSWEEIHHMTRALAERVSHQKWDGILAITRGGMVPAALLAQALKIRVIDTICISSYDGQDQRALEVLKEPGIDVNKNWLIVDDLVDTGETAKVVREEFPESTLVTLFAKPKGEKLAHHYVEMTDQETWVFFPWEEGDDE